MAQSRYKFFDTIYNPYLVHTQKGFPTTNLQELFTFSDNLTYKIPLQFEYRPDLIAQKFYGDPKLSWIITYANGFYNSPEDYVKNSTIRIPRHERVIAIL